jgi:hypothetical protein
MVEYNYSFDGGVDGANVPQGGGTDSGGDIPTSVSVGVNGTMTFAATGAVRGPLSCAMTTTAATVAMYAEYNVTPANRYTWRTYLRLSSLPSVRTILGRFRSSLATPATIMSMSISTANTIGFYNAVGTWIDEGVYALSANTTYRIEFAVDIAAATVEWKLFLGDSTTVLETKLATAQNVGVETIGKIRFGRVVGSAWIGTITWDDWNLKDLATGFPGPVSNAQATVRPSGVVSNPGAFTIGGGSVSLEAALADESDLTYIESGANPASGTVTVAFPELAAGTVTVNVRHKADTVSPPISRVYSLMQGTTVINSRTVNPLPTVATAYSWSTSAGETSAITDRTQLRLRVVDTAV